MKPYRRTGVERMQMDKGAANKPARGWRRTVHEIIFESDTPTSKWFDILLIVAVLLNVLVIMLDSVRELQEQHGSLLYATAWFFTILFTLEYLLRLACVVNPLQYALSFFGIVDFLAIFPAYLGLLFTGTRYLSVVRVLRVLRIFHVLKLRQFTEEGAALGASLYASRRKIFVFLFTVVTLVIIIGALMYIIEGEENGFTSIPVAVYWTIVTLTTVGYGDISPQTGLGQFLASVVMILGYSIIAVPTGIVTVEWVQARERSAGSRTCPDCGRTGHDEDADYCKNCGGKL